MNEKNKKIAWGVVIVAYNPSIELLKRNVSKILSKTEHLVVVNNGEKIEHNQVEQVINLNKNFGIAYAQNLGFKRLQQQGVDIVFFLDQDSQFENDFFDKMVCEWQNIQSQHPRLGLLSPLIINKDTQLPISILVVNDHRLMKVNPNQVEGNSIDNTLPISSGVLVSAEAYSCIHGANEKLFIDWVDFDLDIKLLQQGYQIKTTKMITLSHKIGNPVYRTFIWKKIPINQYALFREFYYSRNGQIMKKKYGHYISGISWYANKEILLRFIMMLYEPHKIMRFFKLLSGIIKGKIYNFTDDETDFS